MQITGALDLEQLRNLTMEDRQLMQDILSALIDDTTRQTGLLDAAVRDNDGPRVVRLARCSTRACANVGANAAADVLKSVERHAGTGEFNACRLLLATLRAEIERLRAEAARI